MRTRSLLSLAALFCSGVFTAQAALQTSTVTYQDEATRCAGYLAFDDAQPGTRPGILVVHDWMGLTDGTKKICDDLARLGYVAFAADIYGEGVRPQNAEQAAAQAGKYKGDRATLRQRTNAAYQQLLASPQVEKAHTAVIGYCFGGTTALELARSGAPLTGVVTFHGGLDSPAPADGANIRAHVLVLHGADDPLIRKEDLEAFQEEMRTHHVDWQMNSYGDAVHAFTVKSAGSDKSKGVAYNEKADKRSWQAMKDFFAEIFR